MAISTPPLKPRDSIQVFINRQINQNTIGVEVSKLTYCPNMPLIVSDDCPTKAPLTEFHIYASVQLSR